MTAAQTNTQAGQSQQQTPLSNETKQSMSPDQAAEFQKAEQYFSSVSQTVAPVQEQNPVAPVQPEIKFDGKTFKSQEELVNYVRELENVALNNLKKPKEEPKSDPVPEVKASSSDPNLSDLIFEDTSKALEIIQQRATETAQRNLQIQLEQRERERKFYESNPDLSDKKDIVESIVNANFQRLKDMDISDAYSEVAKLTRDRVAKLTGQANTTIEKLPNGQASVTGQGQSQPTAAVPVAVKATTFAEELAAFQATKR